LFPLDLDDRGKIDYSKRFLGSHYPKRHHENCPDDDSSGTINLQSREFSKGENEVAGEENDICSEDAGIGEHRRIYLHQERGLINVCIPA
jgi:hypothetical protein